MLRTKILKDTALLNLASIVAQLLAVAQSFLLMRFMGPAGFGAWAGLNLMMTYCAYSHVGIEYGLGVRLAYHRGAGGEDRVRALQDTAYLSWTVLAFVTALGVAGYALLHAQPTPSIRLALLVIAAIIPLSQQALFLSRWQTSVPMDFSLGSALTVVQSFVSFVLVVPLAYVWGVPGVALGTGAAVLATLFGWRSRTAFRPTREYSRAALRELLRYGTPILLVAMGGMLLQTADRLIVLALLGSTQLGFYGVTSLGGSFFFALLSQGGNAMSPHIAAELGRSGDRPDTLARFLVGPTLVFAALSALGILLLAFVVPPLVQLVLPRFLPGLGAFAAFVPGFFFLSITLTAGNILNVVLIARGRQRVGVALMLAAIGIEVGGAYAFIHLLGWGIAGAAIASTLAYAIYGLTVLALATSYVLPEVASRWRFLGKVMIPGAYALLVAGAIYGLTQRLGGAHPLLTLALQLAAALLAYLPVLWWIDREVALWAQLAPLMGQGLDRVLGGRFARLRQAAATGSGGRE